MSIASLLASLKNDATHVTALQPSLHKGLSGNATVTKNVTRVTAANDEAEKVTKLTKLVTAVLPLEAPPLLGCNTVTTVTQKINVVGLHAQFSANDDATRTDESEALRIATRAIGMAALSDEQRLTRLADSQRDPAIARFWALAWPEAHGASPDEQTRLGVANTWSNGETKR